MRKRNIVLLLTLSLMLNGCGMVQQFKDEYESGKELQKLAENSKETFESLISEEGVAKTSEDNRRGLGDLKIGNQGSTEDIYDETVTDQNPGFMNPDNPIINTPPAIEDEVEEQQAFNSVRYIDDVDSLWAPVYSGWQVKSFANDSKTGSYTILISDNNGEGKYYNFGQLIDLVDEDVIKVNDINVSTFSTKTKLEDSEKYINSVFANISIEETEGFDGSYVERIAKFNREITPLKEYGTVVFPDDDAEYECRIIREGINNNEVIGLMFTLIDR